MQVEVYHRDATYLAHKGKYRKDQKKLLLYKGCRCSCVTLVPDFKILGATSTGDFLLLFSLTLLLFDTSLRLRLSAALVDHPLVKRHDNSYGVLPSSSASFKIH